jgi:hypothetical protein
MFRQSKLKRCVWAAVAAFSAIVVAGNGLHWIPGLGHDCQHSPFEAEADCRFHEGHDGFSGEPKDSRPAISVSHDGGDCPICRFFTQAQSVPPTFDVDTNSNAVERQVPTVHSIFLADAVIAYSSRAPPSCV